MTRFKYVVLRIKYPRGGNTIDYCRSSKVPFTQELPVMFCKTLTHKEMFESVAANRDIWNNEPELVSAGFCEHGPNGWRCFGESTSLLDAGWKAGTSRNEIDSELMNNYDTTHGMTEIQ